MSTVIPEKIKKLCQWKSWSVLDKIIMQTENVWISESADFLDLCNQHFLYIATQSTNWNMGCS